MNTEEGDKESQVVAFIGISSGNHGEHEYQQLSMEDHLVDKVCLTIYHNPLVPHLAESNCLVLAKMAF